MDESNRLAQRFEAHRPHLRAVAYRMLGSLGDADDAVQETWLRLSRADTSGVANLGGWLTTTTGRVCLDMLRSRAAHREQPRGVHLPDPIVDAGERADPERDVLLADAVGLGLLVVLDTLAPAQRLAFVLHDMFSVPFDTIAVLLGRSAASVKMLASRARRRVRAAAPPDVDLARQRQAVEAFFAAAREGDFEALVAVLAPDVVLRGDGGAARPSVSVLIRGASEVGTQALHFAQLSTLVRPALVNGVPGAIVMRDGQLFSVMAFTVVQAKIAEIDILADPERLDQLDL